MHIRADDDAEERQGIGDPSGLVNRRSLAARDVFNEEMAYRFTASQETEEEIGVGIVHFGCKEALGQVADLAEAPFSLVG